LDLRQCLLNLIFYIQGEIINPGRSKYGIRFWEFGGADNAQMEEIHYGKGRSNNNTITR
jgi:hypothetical protein